MSSVATFAYGAAGAVLYSGVGKRDHRPCELWVTVDDLTVKLKGKDKADGEIVVAMSDIVEVFTHQEVRDLRARSPVCDVTYRLMWTNSVCLQVSFTVRYQCVQRSILGKDDLREKDLTIETIDRACG